jgi:hypothetical protein
MKWRELSPKGYDDSSEQVNFGYRTFCQRYFELLDSKTYLSRLKLLPWALAEHPQSLIDSIQYSCDYRGRFANAPYSIVKQVGRKRNVFFACVRGVIAPCATNWEK